MLVRIAGQHLPYLRAVLQEANAPQVPASAPPDHPPRLARQHKRKQCSQECHRIPTAQQTAVLIVKYGSTSTVINSSCCFEPCHTEETKKRVLLRSSVRITSLWQRLRVNRLCSTQISSSLSPWLASWCAAPRRHYSTSLFRERFGT